MKKRIDYEHIFPRPEAQLKLMRYHGAPFMRCPTGHDLPHRTGWGRCSALDCCDYGEHGTVRDPKQGEKRKGAQGLDPTKPYKAEMDLLPRGEEHRALKRNLTSAEEATMVRAQSEEALKLMEHLGVKNARDALMLAPTIPDLPDNLPADEQVKQNWSRYAPYAQAVLAFEMQFSPDRKTRVEIAERWLEFGGQRRTGEPSSQKERPLVMVQINGLPYDKQGEEKVVPGNAVRMEESNGSKREGSVAVRFLSQGFTPQGDVEAQRALDAASAAGSNGGQAANRAAPVQRGGARAGSGDETEPGSGTGVGPGPVRFDPHAGLPPHLRGDAEAGDEESGGDGET